MKNPTLVGIIVVAVAITLSSPTSTTEAGPLRAVARAVKVVGKGAAKVGKGASKAVSAPFRGKRSNGCN